MLVHLSIPTKDAILACRPKCGNQTYDLTAEDLKNLTEGQRVELASIGSVGQDECRYYSDRLTVTEATPGEVAKALDARIVEKAKKASEKTAKEKKQLAEMEVIASKWLAEHEADPSTCISARYGAEEVHGPYYGYEPPVLHDELANRVATVLEIARPIVAKRNAEAKKAREARTAKAEADEEAKTAAFDAERTEWIAAHGSSRLQRLVKEEIGYGKTYRDERLAQDRPAWKWCTQELVDTRDATEADLDALDEARVTAKDAKLQWLTVECGGNEYDDCDCPAGGIVLVAELLGRTIIREIG